MNVSVSTIVEAYKLDHNQIDPNPLDLIRANFITGARRNRGIDTHCVFELATVKEIGGDAGGSPQMATNASVKTRLTCSSKPPIAG